MAIEILISSDVMSDSVDNPLSTEQASKPKSKDEQKVDGKMSKEQLAVMKFVITQAKTWAMLGVTTFTDYTGNSMLQEKIDNVLTIADMGITIGGSFAVSRTLGVLAVAGYIGKASVQQFNNHMEHKKAVRTQSFIEQGQGKRNINGGNYGV